ncbi:hypothetical protein PCANC_08203 [Puccinia coronata f. sp. avenae]|uniref:Secreted protein n=1 Tax=Puccinia coronata f. sp. avenae TaxID=200324 RepID=A0A2N5SL16_9BASI|nr:hypothetical protein PCASD_19845 [Puccinia coronata f. sp. avenae]PLW15355.1 hypothetical protein PCANC_13693 [Puccinia coronata f. sp. avenae]PLW50079.1 hypothetical protein PCANC_08203 [Puccinia coronata f. sp. avenae]PLW50555.1 hypothetical protein PCASD_01499 [Puccinia coronata f. sp. avenae]
MSCRCPAGLCLRSSALAALMVVRASWVAAARSPACVSMSGLEFRRAALSAFFSPQSPQRRQLASSTRSTT